MEKAQLELILINISGQDHPGVTSALSEILAKYNAGILDIGQADIHHTLSLGILIKTDSLVSGNIMKELLFKATELNVNIRFSPVSIDEYEKWVGMQGKDRWIITIERSPVNYGIVSFEDPVSGLPAVLLLQLPRSFRHAVYRYRQAGA